jgi:hypothetical protein
MPASAGGLVICLSLVFYGEIALLQAAAPPRVTWNFRDSLGLVVPFNASSGDMIALYYRRSGRRHPRTGAREWSGHDLVRWERTAFSPINSAVQS